MALRLPDGFKPDATFEKFQETAGKHGMKQEAAQEVFDLYVSARQAQEAAANDVRNKWATALQADKEIGGAAFEASKVEAKKAMTRFASPELQSFLHNTGLGNHPELVRAFVKIGKALGEDTLDGATKSNHATEPQSQEARLRARFPTMFKE